MACSTLRCLLAGVALAAAGCEDSERSEVFTLAVRTTAPFRADVRITVAPAPSSDHAEALQTRLSRAPLAHRSVLRSPFTVLDIDVSNHDGPTAADQVRSVLEGQRTVTGIETCPCPVDDDDPVGTEVARTIYKLRRSCSGMPRPVPVAGCVVEYKVEVLPDVTASFGDESGPVKIDPAGLHLFRFEAWARRGDGMRIGNVEARFTTGPSTFISESSPDTTADLTPGRHTLPLSTAGHPPYHEKRAEFSPGRVHPDKFPPVFGPNHGFAVHNRPLRSLRSPVKVQGLSTVFFPAAERPDARYEVLVTMA